MSATRTTAVRTGRKIIALGHASQNTPSPEGAKESDKLPSGWKWKTIPDLVSDDGVFIDGDWVESKDQDPNGGVRLIQLADVGDGVYRDKSDRFMTKAKADALRCTFLKDGDVLIARMPDPLGRACIFPGDAKPSVTVVDVAIVRSGNGEFDHRWLACFVNAHPFRSAISGLQAGSTRKRISRGNLATIPLPVPPLHEQQRIVAEIEKQFTRLEAGVAALRRVQANLKRYRAAVLKAACEGQLTSDWRDKEASKNASAENDLNKILGEIEKSKRRAARRSEGTYGHQHIAHVIPQEWRMTTVDSLFNLIDYRGRNPPKAEAGRRLITAKNIKMGHLSDEPKAFVSEDTYKKWMVRGFPQKGDIFFVTEGATMGFVALNTRDDDFALAQRTLTLQPAVRFETRFFLYFMMSSLFQELITSNATGSAAVGIKAAKFRSLPIPFPPLAEQTRIVAEVERRLSVVEELEAAVSANLQRAVRLRQSILQKAFTGEL